MLALAGVDSDDPADVLASGARAPGVARDGRRAGRRRPDAPLATATEVEIVRAAPRRRAHPPRRARGRRRRLAARCRPAAEGTSGVADRRVSCAARSQATAVQPATSLLELHLDDPARLPQARSMALEGAYDIGDAPVPAPSARPRPHRSTRSGTGASRAYAFDSWRRPTVDEIRASTEGAACTTISTAGCGRETIVELAEAVGYDALPTKDPDELAAWMTRGANRADLVLYLETFVHTVAVMQTREALVRVARECAEDLAGRRRRVRRGPVRAGAAHRARPDLDEVVEAVLEGFRQGSEARPITVRLLCTAMRTAALSLQIAELAVRWRDEGVCGFDIAGAEAGYPPTRHLDAFQYVMRENFHITIHAGEAFGLPSIWEALQFCGAERLGHGVRIVDDIVVRRRRRPEARPPRELRPRPACPLEMCPTSNVHSGAARSIEEHPIGLLSRPALPRHGEHRQPADEPHHDVGGVREARRHVRVGLERDPLGDDQRHEERVPAVRPAPAPHQRGHQALVRRQHVHVSAGVSSERARAHRSARLARERR